MDFQEASRRYAELRQQFDAGEIDEEEFQDEIEGLQVQDEEGIYWTIGAQTGKWYRFDGQDWVRETPIPMTKHKGRGIPEPVGPHEEFEEREPFTLPRWSFIGCGGFVLLVVVAGLIVLGVRFMQSRPQIAGPAPTPTLVSGIDVNTPTPAPTPEATATVEPTPTEETINVYANTAFGFSVEYPGSWQAKEGSGQVALAPTAAGLNTIVVGAPAVSDVSFAIGKSQLGAATTSVSALQTMLTELPADPDSGETGTRTVNGVEWVIGQFTLNSGQPDSEMIAYIATTLYADSLYTVLAAAPTDEWNTLAPTFQMVFDSVQFTEAQPVAAATPTLALTNAITATADEEEADEEAEGTPAPAASPTPVVYVVQEGDTLGGIAFQFDVDVDLLQAANDITDPTKLRVGQELTIPGEDYQISGSGARPTGSTPAARRTPTPVTAATPEEAGTPTATATPVPAATPTPEEAVLAGKIVYPVFVPERNVGGQPGTYDIWMSDPQGNNQEVLVYDASQPDINVGGDLLAYRSWNVQSRGINFLTIGGGRADKLTDFVEDALPAWDPNSVTIVFPSRREGDRVPRLYRVSQANKAEYPLGMIGEYVDTFPDGRLVFKGCTPEGACGLYTSGAEGGDITLISGNTNDTGVAVSPDGSQIAFMSNARDGAGNYEIFVMGSGGSNVARLTDNAANDGLPAWSPDGKTIAFASDRDGVWAIWAMNPDGSNQRKLFNMGGSPDGIVSSERPISKGWVEERIAWSR
jgi:LysM repeat protein